MALESSHGKMERNMKAAGKTTRWKDKVREHLSMEIIMRDNLKTMKLMDMGYSPGIMEKYIKLIGKIINYMARSKSKW